MILRNGPFFSPVEWCTSPARISARLVRGFFLTGDDADAQGQDLRGQAGIRLILVQSDCTPESA